MWIDDLAVWAETLVITGLPTPVYVQTIPAEVSPAVMFAAPQIGVRVDPDLPGYHHTSFQMVVRAKKSQDAEILAQRVSDAIETEQRVSLTNIRVNFIRPRHLPTSFPRSDGDFHEAVVNFDLCFIRLMA